MCSTLLELPGELRIIIYEAALICERPLHPPRAGEPSIAGLLATNKQIRNEALELFRKDNLFHLTHNEIHYPDYTFIQRLKITKGVIVTGTHYDRNQSRDYEPAAHKEYQRYENLTTLELNWPHNDDAKDIFFSSTVDVASMSHYGWNSKEFYFRILNKPGVNITWKHEHRKQTIRLRNDSDDHLSTRDTRGLFATLWNFLRETAHRKENWQVERPSMFPHFNGILNVQGNFDYDAPVPNQDNMHTPPYSFDLEVWVSTDPDTKRRISNKLSSYKFEVREYYAGRRENLPPPVR